MARKVLILAASPIGSARLQGYAEVREILDLRQASNCRDDFEVKIIPAARPEDFYQALLNHRPEVVHFVGHGVENSGLMLETDDGGSQLVSGDRLKTWFEVAKSVKCVILNACYSEVQGTAIAEVVPCVIGMAFSICDRAALEFSIAFYRTLFAGESYRDAFRIGKGEISDSMEANTLVDKIRDEVEDRVAIDLEPPGSRMSIDTLESFVGSLNWVKKHSRSLCGLLPSHRDQLLGAINQAKREPILDFHPIEIEVLELASHYVFYCLQNRPSPTLKIPKKEYVRRLTEFSQNNQKIRVGKEKLSILVRESGNRLNCKENLSKIIEKLEVRNEV